jgi:hypothetical protein
MPGPQTNRRDFLHQAGALGAACVLPVLAPAHEPPAPLVRRNIADFARDDRALDALRAGVRKMRDLDPRNPFSWSFQANIHWRPMFPGYVYEQADTAADPGPRLFRDDGGFIPEPDVFNQCPHGNWWFLPWHRAYLYFFERILRWAAGEPRLTLPYWNYCDPGQRELPAVFRAPKVKGQPNPLYLPESVTFHDKGGKPQVFPLRDGPLNNGLAILSPSAAGRDALKVIPFTTSPPSPADECFGSPRACHPTCTCGSGAIETAPHDKVHEAIGGNSAQAGGGLRGGFMGAVPTAARDPIFWLHHANIDRLWESWLRLGGGRKNPEDPDWLDREFSFYDVQRGEPKQVTVTPRALLDLQALGYRYAELETLPEAVAVRRAPAPPPPSPSFVSLAATTPPEGETRPGGHPPERGRRGIELENTRATTVPLPPEAGVKAESFRAPPPGRAGERGEMVLSLEGIAVDHPPGVYYEVYLNPPAGEKLTPESPYHAGSLTFFGLGHRHAGHRPAPSSVRFTVPEAVRKLLEEGKLAPSDLKATFVPETGTEPIRKDVEVQPRATRAAVTVRQARFLLVR